MVLISGSPNTGGEERTSKGQSEVQHAENGSLTIAGELDKNLEQGRLSWQGTGDPLPQLLAVVPSLENCINNSDLHLEEDSEEYDDFSELSDNRSIASDDSFYPPDIETRRWYDADDDEDESANWEYKCSGYDGDSCRSWESVASPEPLSFFKACTNNNVIVLKALMRQGLTEEEVCETDRNNRTGLLIACYQGYVDIVIALSQCPYVDVNWQDNEGNTALITASQAGHITITNYLLNYYSGLYLERRNIHGYTALMKAAIQGRTDCVRTLMLAGADIHAADPSRGFTSIEWARFTGRYETGFHMQKLLEKPLAEQFSDQFNMEWPKMKELLAKASESKSCSQIISEYIKSTFTLNYFNEPGEDGVLDYMVKITTSISSPFVAVSCRTVCPGSPPCIGKCRYSVQEILRKQRAGEIKPLDETNAESYEKHFQNSKVIIIPKKKERRASLQISTSQRSDQQTNRRISLLPLHLLRRSSVRPGCIIPKVRISKAPTPTYYPENRRRKSSVTDNTYLQIPKWRYKELKEERKKAEEEALRKVEEAQKLRKTSSKRTHQ